MWLIIGLMTIAAPVIMLAFRRRIEVPVDPSAARGATAAAQEISIVQTNEAASGDPGSGHARWVRITHWIVVASFLTLAVTGFLILMSHPRLYWGEVGNDLTPALLELPISRNHRHGGWEASVPFFGDAGSPVSAARTFEIFNENGWARSLHFLAAWFLGLAGIVYVLAGVFSGHLRRHLLPRVGELSPGLFWRDLLGHLRLQINPARGGPPYGLLQKSTYSVVVFLLLPLMILTGFAMAPALNAAYPVLTDLFGGSQSARTIHFFAFVALVLFLVVHVLMVLMSGFRRQLRAMTIGG